MVKPTLRDLLRPYGIDGPEALASLTGCDAGHAKKVLSGSRPVSKKLALKLKDLSRGALSLDQLLSASDGKAERKRTTIRSSPTARS